MQTTLKTVTLLALSSAARGNELHKLDLTCLTSQPDKMIFQIPGRVKHSKKGKPNPPLVFSQFPQDPILCPVKTLQAYIDMTKPWRQQNHKTSLFLTTVKPHGPVAKTTIANWVKKTLTLAGIQGFSAHSTRAASTSKAKAKGLSLQTILQKGNWKSHTVWEKHYHKNVIESSTAFQAAVLS
jgi:integrase